MKGAMAELWAKMIMNPNRRRRMSMGISHHSFRSQKKWNSSEAMAKRPNKLRMNCMVSPSFLRIVCDLPFHHCLWMRQCSSTSTSMPQRRKVLKASSGVFTIGSPFRLNEVLSTTGTPVASPNCLMSR